MSRNARESGLSRKKQVCLYMWSGVGYRKTEKRKCERFKRLHVLLVISISNGLPFRTERICSGNLWFVDCVFAGVILSLLKRGNGQSFRLKVSV
jgi:hypothetical protein